jgi:hypothetical protein
MMMHLEIQADDLGAGVAHAVAVGATLAEFQPQDDVRVCLDPAGHPFCLFTQQGVWPEPSSEAGGGNEGPFGKKKV